MTSDSGGCKSFPDFAALRRRIPVNSYNRHYEGDWTWKFAQRAADQFDGLDPHVQDRIVSKLDEVVDSAWREPVDFLEPLTGGPFSKLRVGQYRLACVPDHEDVVLEIHRIEHRSGAYTADD